MRIITPVLILLLGTSLVLCESDTLRKEKKSSNEEVLGGLDVNNNEGQKKDPATNPSKTAKFSLSGKKRSKTIKEDQERVKRLHEVGIARGSLPSNALDELSTPTIESEGYYGYPSTLDYIIDVYVESTDGSISGYTTIVDTGSSNLAISVSDCSDCGSGSSDLEVDYYSPEMCVEVVYGSGSWSGLMTASTYVAMGDEEEIGTDIYFSAITSGSTFFTSDGFQGILGLGYSGICSDYTTCSSASMFSTSAIAATPYTDSLVDDEVIDENIFTISFCDEDLEVAIGGIDESLYTGDITYVDTQKTYGEFYGYYLISIDAVTIDGTSVSDVSDMNSIGGTLVDSGTTLLYVSTTVYKALKSAVKSATGVSTSFFEWESCLSEDEITDFPTVVITSGSYDLELEAEDYLLYYYDCYYWGVSSSSVPIIGNIALQDLMVVFDKENNQVGFADAVCSSSSSSSSSSTSDLYLNDHDKSGRNKPKKPTTELLVDEQPITSSSSSSSTTSMPPPTSTTSSGNDEEPTISVDKNRPKNPTTSVPPTTTSSSSSSTTSMPPPTSTTSMPPPTSTTSSGNDEEPTISVDKNRPKNPTSEFNIDSSSSSTTTLSSSKSFAYYSVSGFALFAAVFAVITYYRNKSRSSYSSIPFKQSDEEYDFEF